MSGHFDYLLDDDGREFFQKVAEERAVSGLGRQRQQVALESVKTASAVAVDAFEKVASRLDADIEIIKMAGPCGLDMGATVRAMNYMSRLEYDHDITDEQYFDTFSKVAFAAIDADFAEARKTLHMISSPEIHDDVDRTLGKIAFDLLKDFEIDLSKKAGAEKILPFVGRLLTRKAPLQVAEHVGGKEVGIVGKALKSKPVTNAVTGAAESGVASKIPSLSLKARAAGSAASLRQVAQRRAARQMHAEADKLRSLKQYQKSLPTSAAGPHAAVGKQIGSVEQSLETARNRLREKVRAPKNTLQRSRVESGRANLEAGRGKAKAEAARAAEKGQQNAPTAKTPESPGASKPSDEVIKQNANEKGGIWSKAYEQGWGALTDAEKTKLMMQAGGGVIGAKALGVI